MAVTKKKLKMIEKAVKYKIPVLLDFYESDRWVILTCLSDKYSQTEGCVYFKFWGLGWTSCSTTLDHIQGHAFKS